MKSRLSRLMVYCSAVSALCIMIPVVRGASLITTSSSGRYRVSGPDSLENTDYTRWAEDTTRQLERVLGVAVPQARAEAMEIVLEESAAAGGAVSIDCARRDGALRRVMTVPRTGVVDYDRMQEGFVRLVLAGIVERRRTEAGLTAGVPVIPRWLSVGLAQSLDKEKLAQNRKMVSLAGKELETATVGEVLGWDHFPAGWHGRQAVCGILVAWILSFPDAMDRVLERLVRQAPVSPSWLAIAVVNEESVEAMEARWSAWRQRQERAIREFGGLSLALIDQVKAELPLVIKVSNSRELSLQPGEVIEARKKYPSAVMMGAVGRMERLRVVTMGKAPELIEVADRYCRFFEGVACGSWTMVLKWRLKRAETELRRLESLTCKREAYLDEVEGNFSGHLWTGEDPIGATLVPELEKSRIESYIDEAEQRFHKH